MANQDRARPMASPRSMAANGESAMPMKIPAIRLAPVAQASAAEVRIATTVIVGLYYQVLRVCENEPQLPTLKCSCRFASASLRSYRGTVRLAKKRQPGASGARA